MDADREWEQWRDWLGDAPRGRNINAQMVEMLAFRQIWDGFAAVYIRAPERARKYGTFLSWARWNYARSQGIAIRRMADPRGDVVSLASLLDRVWRYPTVLSRERFLATRGESGGEENRWFNKMAGEGDFMDPRIPAADWDHLKATARPVVKWVNTSVAHLTKRGKPVPAPPLDVLHETLEEMFALFVKYMQLIHGVTVVSEVVMDPWEAVFRVPWIPDDDHWREVKEAIDAEIRGRRDKALER